jgi:hypothetical protein
MSDEHYPGEHLPSDEDHGHEEPWPEHHDHDRAEDPLDEITHGLPGFEEHGEHTGGAADPHAAGHHRDDETVAAETRRRDPYPAARELPGATVFEVTPHVEGFEHAQRVGPDALADHYASAWSLDQFGDGTPAAIAAEPPTGEPLAALLAPLGAGTVTDDVGGSAAAAGHAATVLWAAFALGDEPIGPDGQPLGTVAMLEELEARVGDPVAQAVIKDVLLAVRSSAEDDTIR